MFVANNFVVNIHYTLTNDAGEVIDTSKNSTPLTYIQGLGQILPALEKEILGKKVGDKLSVKIAAKDGYGEVDERMVQVVPKSELPKDAPLEVGIQFQAGDPHQPIVFTLIELRDEEVVLDGNHPLAGVNLNFDVEVTNMRAATKDELAHGHVHGAGCSH
jgi:FKBP-type peptidyl-prolyl cis-trans isomerase SlyD